MLHDELRRILPALLCLSGPLAAQVDRITEDRVREVVAWLAADERRGRDTGSPELEESANWLAERMASAGLRQAREGAWFHDYTLPGHRIDSSAIHLVLTRKVGGEVKEFELSAGRDVRLWKVSDALSGKEEACTVAVAEDPVLQRLLTATSARRPIVIEVPEDHAFWRESKTPRNVVGGRRGAARPVFLVRDDALPPEPGAGRESSWTANWSVPAAEKVDVLQRNVVGLLPGTTRKDEYVVVSAHYDHIGTGAAVDGDAIFNGADDDATGTTAVILLAEALGKQPPLARSVLFVCFSAEERGLRGSAAFCERPPVPRDQIVANLNLEMLGRPEPGKVGKAWITGADLSDFAAIVQPALQRTGVELVEFPMAAQLFTASDNFSFVRHGIVAHSLSAGSLHADYHGVNDEADRLDIPHMTRIIRALVDVVQELAARDAVPAWNERGRARLERVRK